MGPVPPNAEHRITQQCLMPRTSVDPFAEPEWEWNRPDRPQLCKRPEPTPFSATNLPWRSPFLHRSGPRPCWPLAPHCRSMTGKGNRKQHAASRAAAKKPKAVLRGGCHRCVDTVPAAARATFEDQLSRSRRAPQPARGVLSASTQSSQLLRRSTFAPVPNPGKLSQPKYAQNKSVVKSTTRHAAELPVPVCTSRSAHANPT